MKNRKFVLSLLLGVCAAGATAFAQPGSEKKSGFLTKDGKLTAAFSLKDTQGGFAGFTGNHYAIQPDGSWTVTRVFNQRKYKPHASGKLTAKQLKVLADALAANRVDKLPAMSGSSAQANPLIITVTFGKHRSITALPPGISNPADLPKGPKGDVGQRVLALRKTVTTLLANKKPKPTGFRRRSE